MKRLTTVTSVCVLALVLSLFIASVVSAQASSISTGVVTSVETGDDGGLTAFSIVGGDGGVLRFTVHPQTQTRSSGWKIASAIVGCRIRLRTLGRLLIVCAISNHD